MPPRRLGFKKSRNGCTRCKARRVKGADSLQCDELLPCTNCIRHQAACSLTFTSPATDVSHTSSVDNANQESANNASEDAQSVAASPPAFQQDSVRAKADMAIRQLEELTSQVRQVVDGFAHDQVVGNMYSDTAPGRPMDETDWLNDLQLFHHFFTNVYTTLSWAPEMVAVWRDVVPQLAFSRSYLMHALLALSALHLGYTEPSQKKAHVLASMHHQNTAFKQFNLHVDDVNSDNPHIPVLFAAFTFISGMYTVGTQEGDVLLSDITQCFFLVQGVGNMLATPSIWDSVRASPIGPLITEPIKKDKPTGLFMDRLDELVSLVSTMRVSEPMRLVDEIGVRSQCLAALERLRATYSMMLLGERRAARIWSWPIAISRDFIELVRKGEAMALVILSHYAAMVICYEQHCWYLEGWSERVCRVVEANLVEEQWARWISWPLECVRDRLDVRDLSS